ncbi:Na-translocating system protein MpsC family protein [Pseudalkalibacillus caeni]|uniref:DUF2294 family protein n=1 Tax=Exobacillus caeni TaxID=2574798 RepID=A0A5R9F353_9BACL|nr:Na-translocating system protein MpsC family protein [Pseudalkalibacillus caeni]TLS36756.1 DUF2294 family protein [Pseudalkalibacillus caeni]
MDKKTTQSEISSFVGKLLRDNFGKGPGSVFVSIAKPYITIYLKNFISPMESVLLKQGQRETVERTRDLLMNTLIPEIKAHILVTTGMQINEFYYDWAMHNHAGMFVCVASESNELAEDPPNEYDQKELFENELIRVSKRVEKAPEQVDSWVVNARTLIAERKGILVPIEKELIRIGKEETLKLAKRSLEKNFLHNNDRFEDILNTKIIDVFVDWSFNQDKSYTVFILNKIK